MRGPRRCDRVARPVHTDRVRLQRHRCARCSASPGLECAGRRPISAACTWLCMRILMHVCAKQVHMRQPPPAQRDWARVFGWKSALEAARDRAGRSSKTTKTPGRSTKTRQSPPSHRARRHANQHAPPTISTTPARNTSNSAMQHPQPLLPYCCRPRTQHSSILAY